LLPFVILCYQLIATVTIYFESNTDNIMKIYCNKRLYWKLEIIYYKWLTILNSIKGRLNGLGASLL